MRVYLRALEPEDYLKIYEWRQDDDIENSLGGNRFFVSKEREKQWAHFRSIDDSKGIYLAICLKENNEMIGYCSIINIDLRNLKADIGGWMIGEKKLWNQGYSKEAVELLLKYAFDEYPLHKCYSFCLEDHEISNKTHISLGFKLEGQLRDHIFKGSKFHTLNVYSILRNEFYEKFPKQQ